MDKAKEEYDKCVERRKTHIDTIHSLAERATAACLCLNRSPRLARMLIKDVAGSLAEASKLSEGSECIDTRRGMLIELVEVFGPGLVYILILYLTGAITATAATVSILIFFLLGEYYAYKRYARGLEEMRAVGEKIEEILEFAELDIEEIRRNCGRDIIKYDSLLSKYPDRE